MKVSDWLENAALENKSSDYSSGVTGRTWYNTTASQVKVDDGTNIRAMLRNDGKAIIGNSGTASQNIRFHRGAAGVMQLVTGDDATSEGSLSTSLNKLSMRLESYSNATRPAAGNSGRIIWNTDTSTEQIDNGVSWQEVSATALTAPSDKQNYTLTATVAANALTIALKTAAGSDPTGGDPVKVAFRNATSATGTFSVISSTAATSTVISSGSTAGHASNKAEYIYVYALNNAGTLELAWSSTRSWDEGTVQSTTAEGGAGAADSKTVLYSTTARTNVAIRFLGRLKSTQATAGTWASAISEISLEPSNRNSVARSESYVYSSNDYGSTATKIFKWSTQLLTGGTAITADYNNATTGGTFTINEDGLYACSLAIGYGAVDGFIGISRNSSQTTTSVASINDADRVAVGYSTTAGGVTPATTTLYCVVGDVLRAHGTGSTSVIGAASFRITKLTD